MKPGVKDEIENAVSYFERSFLPELPRLYAHWLEVLGQPKDLTSFLRVGSWVGGDRDGNPFVTADVMREAMRWQSRAALKAYLEQIHALGAELSVSARLAKVTPQLQALADAAHDTSLQRADEPYRQALTGVYARLAAAYPALTGEPPLRAAATNAAPYETPDDLKADLETVLASLIAEHGPAFNYGRPAEPDPPGRHLRLPPGAAGHAPELRGA